MTATIQLSRDTHVYIGLNTTGYTPVAGVPNEYLWKIPVLDGFSFSQATATTEVTLNEMQDASGNSNRGRAMFTNALEPAEWSFSTYARPVFESSKQTAVEEALWAFFLGAKEFDGTAWEQVAGTPGVVISGTRGTAATQTVTFDSEDSDRAELGTFDLYFVLGGCAPGANEQSYSEAAGQTIYKLTGCVVNTAGVDFDIDGITTLNWSGFGSTITQLDASDPVDFSGSANTLGRSGVLATNNFLRNRIASLAVVPTTPTNQGTGGFAAGRIYTFSTTGTVTNPVAGNYLVDDGDSGVTNSGSGTGAEFEVNVFSDGSATVTLLSAGSGYAAADTIAINTATHAAFAGSETGTITITVDSVSAAAGEDFQPSYNLILTGGSINMENNITFLTPEELCRVNTPIGHVTGTRTISGSFTCYLNDDGTDADNRSAAFFRDLTGATGMTRNEFDLKFTVGSVGATASDVGIQFHFPTAHIDIPTHQIEDVISLETNFHALPSSITGADEVKIKYKGIAA